MSGDCTGAVLCYHSSKEPSLSSWGHVRNMPKPERIRRCDACGQFAVYCGKLDEEWVWRCRYCRMVIPLTDEEMTLFGLHRD